MRLIFVGCLLLLLMPGLLLAESTDTAAVRTSPVLRAFFAKHIRFSSVQASLFSYKPELGSLTDVLRSVGVSQIPAVLMPTASIVFEHTPELDSRLEIGYWQMQLEIPPPTSATLTTTLVPISYQLIYRPVLLSEFLPIYFGGGVGFLGASFGGSAIPLIEQQGISFDGSSSGLTGYVSVGAELLRWEDNLALSLELKRVLKTVETTGELPMNVVLDGTAIGLGVRMWF